MGLAHQSVATINNPQFINLEPLDINPLMSSCEIKVLYVGANRNQSYISKQVATQMAKTLRGAPIVGYYKKDKQDFADHGQQMIIDDEGVHFSCLTKPYGFVSPDAKVWFQDFEDQDEFGNSIIRTYLMTTGFLWTGQFEEANQVLSDQGKPQSMELQEKTLKGHWANNIKENMDFFIINDAIFEKLCILGDDVEPCFEGASITQTKIKNTSFMLDNNFKQTLFSMMKDLTEVIKGGNIVAKDIEKTVENTENVEENSKFVEKTSEEEVNKEATLETPAENVDFVKDDKEKKEEKDSQSEGEEQEEKDNTEEQKKKYNLLKQDYDNLTSKYETLEQQVNELRSFKLKIENEQKDKLIGEFYMLSDEDKKDVIQNKDKYSLDEIESKLAVICFKKKVNFNLETSAENENSKKDAETVITTFNIEQKDDSTPEWVKAVESTMSNEF